MNRNLLLSLVAGVDIWAILFVLHFHPPTNSDVLLSMQSKQRQQIPSETTPVQIWITADGRGLWPDRNRRLKLEQLTAHLDRLAAAGEPVDVRLLCDRRLTIDDWRSTAAAISAHADTLRLAPLPDDAALGKPEQ